MISHIVQNSSTQLQDKNISQDGNVSMTDKEIHHFARGLVRDYAINERDFYTLSIADVPFGVQKIFLSILIDIDTYQDYLNTNTIYAALNDYHDDMQFYIDKALNDCFLSDMEEMNLYFTQLENGETFYQRRYE
jgi:hypothetical protein